MGPGARRRRAAVAAAALAALATPAIVSQAAQRAEREVDLRARAAVVNTSADGSAARLAGYYRGGPLGFGALTTLAVVHAGSDCLLKSFVLYNRRGSVSASVRVTRTEPGACGRTSFEGTTSNLRGSGAYDDATGTLTLTGSYDTGTGTLTLRVTGTIRY
jgi:hypothetical protein